VEKIHKCFRILFLHGFLIHPATTRKEDFIINSTFTLDFLVYSRHLKVDKSDSSISSILATTRKEDFIINSTFTSDFLVYLRHLKGDKSDSSISRIIIFEIFIIFFLVFGLLLLI